jgi:hypothetical protein
MAIGVTRSAGYTYAGSTGVLNGASLAQVGGSVKLYVVAAGGSLAALDDGANEAFEAILQLFPALITYYAHASTGAISVIVDGVNAPAASVIQTALQALGSSKGIDLSSATVTDGTSFVVA